MRLAEHEALSKRDQKQNLSCQNKVYWDENKPSSTSIRMFFNQQLFLSGYSLHPHVSEESSIRIHYFLNPLSRMEIFEYAVDPESCGR